MRNNLIKPRAIKVTIREIDAKISQKQYAKTKLKKNFDVYDIDGRNTFVKSKVTTSMIKYAHSFNYYTSRDYIINK